MTYCTLAQLTERYGARVLIDLTDRATPPDGTIDTAVVDRALADTDALIDGYLSARYALPLATTPALVTGIAQDIAIYKLHPQVAPDKIDKDYRDALKLLSGLSIGTVKLDVAGAEPESSSQNDVRTNSPERPFSAESMKGFI